MDFFGAWVVAYSPRIPTSTHLVPRDLNLIEFSYVKAVCDMGRGRLYLASVDTQGALSNNLTALCSPANAFAGRLHTSFMPSLIDIVKSSTQCSLTQSCSN